jgi:hypothetical protein
LKAVTRRVETSLNHSNTAPPNPVPSGPKP